MNAARLFAVLAAASVLAGCGSSSSTHSAPNPSASGEGAGIFGSWTRDADGLPAYDYTMDEINDARAVRADLGGKTDAWHQLGNDAIVANAYNHGYVELWSQQRLYQWANRYDASAQQYAGGFGYLAADGQVASTLWLDRPEGTNATRRFGAGYFEHAQQALGVDVDETVTAPFGDAPVLVHEIRLSNRGDARDLSWWEYWGVNPQLQAVTTVSRGLDAAAFDAASGTLSAKQNGDAADTRPLTIFLSAVDAPVEGYETRTADFFGAGGRAAPSEVAADTAGNGLAGASLPAMASATLFALRAPLHLAAGESRTLRYVYGMAHDADIAALVAQVRQVPDTQADTAAQWQAFMPQADLGANLAWLSRELQWDQYAVRSSSVYEETCGHHVITQGGYYQYGLGLQIAYRDPLQHMLPMIYSDPELAREVIRYSAQQQPAVAGALPYGMGPLCTRVDLGTSNDLDFWLLLSTIEYVEGTRDFAFLDETLPYLGGLPLPALQSGSVWEHLKLAYTHQEDVQLRGPHGGYIVGSGGDWSDLSTAFLQMTESELVPTQLAYIYPRLADLADAHGDSAFAQTVRARAAALLAQVQGEWTGGGWYSRGYTGTTQLGSGAIFGEPQPWAILAGAPDAAQAATLVHNIRRFLTGVDAPPEVKGPALIGSSQSPSTDDPEVTERSQPAIPGGNNAVFVGGVWYAVNGWLSWALGKLDGVVDHAADFAFDEVLRNTLHAHAEAYPQQWNGILNVDDVCNAQFADAPDTCGIGIFVQLLHINGQITHQPAWSLFALLKLAGFEPNALGYEIRPHLPMARWSFTLPGVGIAQTSDALSGYVRPERDGPLHFTVQPRKGRTGAVKVDGVAVTATRNEDGSLSFDASGAAGRKLEWRVEVGK